MAVSDPHLIHSITEMVNHSYYHALKELLPPSQTSYERLSEEDVTDRLEMGDAGARANRVLHLAYREATVVGCCSSTYQPPWTPDGCGHWGARATHTHIHTRCARSRSKARALSLCLSLTAPVLA